MKPIEYLAKSNSKTTKELKETSNDQSRIRTDHEYQKMIRRVLCDIFSQTSIPAPFKPNRSWEKFIHWI